MVSASQQALDMTARVFSNRGDAIITASPTYLGALQAFEASGADVFGADSDDFGVTVEGVEKRLKELQAAGRKCKFMYMVPDFQNPSGTTIPQERRVKILELAEKYGTLVVEDSPYRQVRFEGTAPQTFYKLDGGRGNVITLFTFSKVFVPGFRLGYVLAPAEIIQKYVVLKQAMDLCTSPILQLATAQYLKDGYLMKHVAEVVEVYRQKRDAMLKMLQKYMPQGVKWTRPEGGLFLWVTLPEGIVSVAASAMSASYGARGYVDSLSSVVFPQSIRSIGAKAFYNCPALTSVTMPQGVKLNGVGEDVFKGTPYLQNDANWEDNGLYLANWLLAVKDTAMTSFTVRETPAKSLNGSISNVRSAFSCWATTTNRSAIRQASMP